MSELEDKYIEKLGKFQEKTQEALMELIKADDGKTDEERFLTIFQALAVVIEDKRDVKALKKEVHSNIKCLSEKVKIQKKFKAMLPELLDDVLEIMRNNSDYSEDQILEMAEELKKNFEKNLRNLN